VLGRALASSKPSVSRDGVAKVTTLQNPRKIETMPRIYRAMYHDQAKPVPGAKPNQLGARVPPASPTDVTQDAGGHVLPGSGMSVAPAWRKLPAFLIPERLKDKAPKARGDDRLRIWRHGEGAFVDGAINAQLTLSRTTSKHGEVEPAQRIPLGEYQAALAATRDDWEWDEA